MPLLGIINSHSTSFLSSFKASIYSAVIIPAGSATTAIPNTDDIIVIMRPAVVMGYISRKRFLMPRNYGALKSAYVQWSG